MENLSLTETYRILNNGEMEKRMPLSMCEICDKPNWHSNARHHFKCMMLRTKYSKAKKEFLATEIEFLTHIGKLGCLYTTLSG